MKTTVQLSKRIGALALSCLMVFGTAAIGISTASADSSTASGGLVTKHFAYSGVEGYVDWDRAMGNAPTYSCRHMNDGIDANGTTRFTSSGWKAPGVIAQAPPLPSEFIKTQSWGVFSW